MLILKNNSTWNIIGGDSLKISTKGRYALRIDVKKMNIDSLSMSAEEALKLTNKK